MDDVFRAEYYLNLCLNQPEEKNAFTYLQDQIANKGLADWGGEG